MTATVGSLLDDVHARTWSLCPQAAEQATIVPSDDRAGGLLAAWPWLASATLRALDSVPMETPWLDDSVAVRQVIAEVAMRSRRWRTLGRSSQGEVPPPNGDVLAIAARIGAIADLLSGQRSGGTDVDLAAAVGLQANLVAPVHAVAVTTLAAMADHPRTQAARRLLTGVAVRTERYALVPTMERAGRFEDVAAVRAGEQSLDGAIADWVQATVGALASPRRVTGTALQVAAGDALILTAATATVCRAATQLGHLESGEATKALVALAPVHEAWRAPTRWPTSVRLDGVRDLDQTEASRVLRQMITDTLRQDRDWLPAQIMAGRLDVPALMATMRRGMHGVGNVSLAHYQAVENLVRGRSQLWIAANAITERADWGSANVQAARRKRWVPMPRGEPAGVALLAAARQALTTTTVALAALDATAADPTKSARGSGAALAFERGRIVAHHAGDHPVLFETVRPSASTGAMAERRDPIPIGRPPRMGPRR